MRILQALALAVMLGAWTSALASGPAHFATLYTFTDGSPVGLTQAQGALYGSTDGPGLSGNCGSVFELQPPSERGGAWTETVLYTFSNPNPTDPCVPVGPPVVGTGGILYGVTAVGGAYYGGTLYELVPPTSPGLPWTPSVIYNFNLLPGAPYTGEPTGLIAGPGGSFYVTTTGLVLQFQPPVVTGGPWNVTTIYTLAGGPGGGEPLSLLVGPNGVLYGTTQAGGTAPAGGGTVFELIPPATEGGSWTENVLYSFKGRYDGSTPNAVILGPNGTLYGTTFGTTVGAPPGLGSVWQLTPPTTPGGSWTKTILAYLGTLHQCGPDSPLILRNGNLYGATCANGSGFVYELQAPSAPGGAWTTIRLHDFTNGEAPSGPMVMEPDGIIYGGAGSWTTPEGVIYGLKP